jgi:hypothetical protein
MKAKVALLLAVALAIGCGHKKPKEPKEAKGGKGAPSTTTASAPESGKCEVKGFAYSTPAPGPITDGGAP